ncbi:hypothetical protein AAC387_Pa03g2289 [Persea americana]
MEGVRCIGKDVEEVGEAAKDDKGAKLEKDPSKGEDGGARDEVEELERDREVGEGDEKVARFLALEDVVQGQEGLGFFICCRRSEGMRRLKDDMFDEMPSREREGVEKKKEREGGRLNESKQVEEKREKGRKPKLGIGFV